MKGTKNADEQMRKSTDRRYDKDEDMLIIKNILVKNRILSYFWV
jgi:hypothetical protein